jgi:hypothetical protein
MADDDFPKSLDALTGVVEKLIPPRAYEYLFAAIPGFFFEISIFVSNPDWTCELAARAQDGFGLRHYELVGIALILAFVIGNAFILLITVFQWLLAKFFRHTQKHEYSRIPEGTRKCWALIARQLLSAKYGIDPKKFDQEDWNVLYECLGVPSQNDLRSNIFIMASEAIGWCGFAAMLFGQALRNRYYFIFSLALVATGLINDWHVAKLREDGHYYGFLRVRLLLRELRNSTKVT